MCFFLQDRRKLPLLAHLANSSQSSLSSGASQNPQNVIANVGLGRQYMTLPDGKQYTRRAKPGQPQSKWRRVEQSSAGPSGSSASGLQLFLVFQKQPAGQPDHWVLSACNGLDGNARGMAWQVKGDATMMHYQHANKVDVLNSHSRKAYYILNNNLTPAQVTIIDQVANSEPAPWAENQAAVRENCQGWTIRVLKRLQVQGVVTKSRIDEMEALMEAIY